MASDLNDLTDGADEAGYLKAGLLGFPKSGKTFTAMLLALAAREHFKLSGPIGMFDTEGGSVYCRPWVKVATHQDLLAKKARSFDAMLKWAHACIANGVSVGIVDSVTHPWRELCESYLDAKNADREAKGWNPVERLSFEDWNVLKPRWNVWTEFYLNSPLHLIICGRAGWEYEMETNEKGKKELVKTGVKMKTETEFGFEPSLLIEVERLEVSGTNDAHFVRKATVIGDRFSLIDGKSFLFNSIDASKPEQLRKALDAVKAAFGPHIAALQVGGTSGIDTDTRSQFFFEGGEDAWAAEKKSRTILCEEIQGVIVSRWPGQTAVEKKAKGDMIEEIFKTRSWTKVEGMDSGKLRAGLKAMLEKVNAKVEQNNDADVPQEATT